jgi:hypothetical protein
MAAKHVLPGGLISPGRLVASLAGGLCICCHSAAWAAASPEPIPVQERQIAVAIQAAFADEPADGKPLRLSAEMAFPASAASAEPRWRNQAESALPLRMATRLAALGGDQGENAVTPEALPPSPPGLPTTSAEAPLRLSQMIKAQTATSKSPRWMTLPDQPTQLRSSRSLSMPGAASGGGPLPAGAVLLPLASDDAGLSGDEGFIPGGTPGARQVVASPAEQPYKGLAGSGWEIPPIRWGGSLGYSMQRSSSNSGSSNSSSTAQGLFANLTASSYLYAPWFATVSGRLGITNANSSSSSTTAGNGDDNKSSNVVGGGELNMFSSSRFPFRAYFDRSDSRTSGTIVSQDYVSTRYGLTQNYRADDSMSSGSFMLDRSVVANSDGNNDSVTALSGSYATQTGIWQHNLNGRYSLGEREKTHESARLIGLNSSHTATVSDSLSLGGTMNYSDSELRTADGSNGLYSNRGRYLQLYTYGSWMPEFEDLDDLPLTLNGSLRYGSQENNFGGSQSTAQTMGLNLSGMYRFSNNLTASLNTALNHISVSDSGSRLLTLVGSNVNYVGNPLSFGNYSYNWNVGGSANWQSGAGEVRASGMLGAIATHSLARTYTLGEGQTLSLNYSQSLNLMSSQAVGSSESLSNNLSANYGMYFGERFSGALSGMVSDVYTTGVNAQHYKNLSLGMLGQGTLSQQSSLNLNLMFNWSDQSNQTLDAYGVPQTMNTQRMTINGSASYSHLRFAGVRGLRYNLLFAADTRLRDDRLYGNFNTDQDRSRLSLTNRLDYTLGLLNFRLSLMNNEVGGKKNALLFFQVTRQIGAY